MPYRWETRPGLRRSRIFAVLPAPLLIAMLLLLCFVVLGVARTDSTPAGLPAPAPALASAAPQGDSSGAEADKPHTEDPGLQQEVADLGLQMQQQTMFSVVQGDRMQDLRAQLDTAQKKILAANAERDAALSQATELREELQRRTRHFDAVCEALSTAQGIPPEHRAAMVVLSACPVGATKP